MRTHGSGSGANKTGRRFGGRAGPIGWWIGEWIDNTKRIEVLILVKVVLHYRVSVPMVPSKRPKFWPRAKKLLGHHDITGRAQLHSMPTVLPRQPPWPRFVLCATWAPSRWADCTPADQCASGIREPSRKTTPWSAPKNGTVVQD